MLRQDANGNYILESDYRKRYLALSSKQFAKFKNKVRNKDIKYNADSYAGFDHIIVSIRSNKKQNKKINITGNFILKVIEWKQNLVPININRSDCVELPSYKKLNDEIYSFIKNRDKYTQNNIFYKKSILLYGPPGNGKTSYIRSLVSNNNLPKNKLIIWCETIPSIDMLNELKKIDALKIFIFEEIVTMMEDDRDFDLKDFLEFMDGEHTLDNAIYLLTTNHPEKLPENIASRPTRINKIIEIPNPPIEEREFLLKMYFKDQYTDDMAELTYDLSIDQIKELFIIYTIENKSFDDAVKFVRQHKEKVKESFNKYNKIGISE